MSLLSYDLADIPDDLMGFLIEDSTLDFIAIFLCATIYWGGTAIWIYLVIYNFHWTTTIAVWIVSAMLNFFESLHAVSNGLRYVDAGSRRKQCLMIFTGPVGSLRIIALLTFFHLRIGRTDLLHIRPDKWDSDAHKYSSNSIWIDIFKEMAMDRGNKSFKQLLKHLWKIANKRIEII